MKLKLLPVALFAITSFACAQQKPLWNVSTKSDIVKLDSKMQVPTNHLLDLDVDSLKTSIQNAPERFSDAKTKNTIISLPNERKKKKCHCNYSRRRPRLKLLSVNRN